MLRILSLGWRPARAAGMLGSSELTWTGLFCWVVLPRPSWPKLLSPQHHTVWSVISPQAWWRLPQQDPPGLVA